MRRKPFSWQLPREIEARLGESSWGRQRAIHEADHLLVILHSPPEADTHTRAPEVFLRKPDGTLLYNGMSGGEAKLKRLLAQYRELLERYDDAHDAATSATDLFQILEHAGPLNRASGHLASALQSAREHSQDDAFLIAMRDEAYEISRGFDLLIHDVKLEVDYRIARSTEAHSANAERMAAAQHKLNILVAATFPLVAVATLFGMNLVHGLEGRPVFFWLVSLAAGGLGGFTVLWVTNRLTAD